MVPPTAAERGREVRETLLATAGELIAELGWNSVSTRILAQRAGVRPGLVHYHFASLPDLLREAAMRTIRRFLDSTTEVLDAAPSATAGIEELLSVLEKYGGPDPLTLLMSEAFMTATRDEQLRAELGEAIDRFRRDLTDRLARSGHGSPESAATAVMALLDGFVLHKALNPAITAATITPSVRRITAIGDESAGGPEQQPQHREVGETP
ncbi:AcrR family transcriptional regulator [Lipingzhangella halophila]|uniref:AcrR family transcriptional regulator n=1 Tax=Lipingzhangella halophila TaxID=1783352 RepID=A0A7W7RDI1_9ACTN|nr:TetR/AcrR family transcriptional regulator [Lipingzhangella halophila]MBB4929980.1 AcrR family transcriptional regulator [Lipingzhangella halophila]